MSESGQTTRREDVATDIRAAEHRAAMSRRPGVPAVVCFMIGIALHPVMPHLPQLWLVLLAIATIAAVILRHSSAWSCGLLMLSVILAGVAIAQIESFYYPPDHISGYATDEPRLAWLELKIDDEPRLLTDPFSAHPMPPRQAALASVLRVKTTHGWEDSSGQMLVTIAQPNPHLAMGQHVRVIGQLERPAPAMNAGQFDWANYYREQRILTSLHIIAAANITILSKDRIDPLDWLRRRTRQLLDDGFASSRSLDHALLRALLLGDPDPELRDVQDQFRHTGTSHHLSLSGLHVAVLGGFVYLICRLFRLRPRWSVGIGYLFILLYGAVALPSPPIARVVLLCTFFSIGVLLRRSRDPVQLLSLSLLAMLIYHPADLYNAGFQLGMGTVLALMIFSKPFLGFMRWLVAEEFALPNRKAPVIKRAIGRANSRFYDAFSIAMLAWFVSVPLVVYHFNQLSLWAIVASLVLAPFVFASLISGLLKIILTLLWPTLSPQWAAIAAGPVAMMRFVLSWLAKLPGSDWPIPQLPLWGLLICYAFYLLLLIPTARPKLRIAIRFSPVASCALALFLPFWLGREHSHGDALSFTLLSLGAGQSAVVETPSGRTLMVDAGSESYSELLTKCINPFMRATQHTTIDTLLLTHCDYDHISAAATVAQVYDVHEVLTGGEFREHARGNPPAEALLRTLDALDLPPRVISPGDRIPIGRDVEVDVLWPPPHRLNLSSNDTAVVAHIRYAGRSILITGDIQETAEKELLKNPDELRADILIAPHHGSSEVTTPAFVRAVHPSIILSSNDRTLSGKQRRFEQMIGDAQLYRTHKTGAITVKIAKDGTISVETYVPAPSTQPSR